MGTKRLLQIIIVVWTIFIMVFLGLYLIDGHSGVTIDQQSKLSSSFASATAFGDNMLIYSDGQSLVSYNYTTGESKIIGAANAGLNTIDTVSVSPDSNYVLFHDTQVSQTGKLALQLQSTDLDPTLPYWWLYSVQTQSYRPLAQNTILAQVDNNNAYAITGGAGGETLTTYKASNLQALRSISIPGSIAFYPVRNGFLLQTPVNKVLFTKDGVVNQVLLNSATLVGVAPNENSALALTINGNSRDLTTINLQKNTTTNVASDVINEPVWLNSGIALYANSQGQLFTYSLVAHKLTQWKLSGSVSNPDITTTKLIALVGPSAAVIQDQSSNYYLLGSGLAPASIAR